MSVIKRLERLLTNTVHRGIIHVSHAGDDAAHVIIELVDAAALLQSFHSTKRLIV